MTDPSAASAHITADLAGCSASQLQRWIEQQPEPAQAVQSITDESERLINVNLARALELANIAAELAAAMKSPQLECSARRVQGQALAYANQFDQALSALELSASLAQRAGVHGAAARAWLTSVHALARLGRFDEALRNGESARGTFSSLGESVWAAKADVNIGVVHRMRDDPQRALEHFDRARTILSAEPISAAQIDSNRAEALLELNRFSDAEAAFNAALEAFNQAGMSRGAAIVEGNLADLMNRQGRFERALKHFERARRHMESARGPGDVARLAAEQAEALATLGLLDEAMAEYRANLPQLDAHHMAFEAARSRAGLARVLLRMGNLQEARSIIAEATQSFAALQHPTGLAHLKLLQGELELRSGRHDLAAALFDEALQLLAHRPADAAVARLHAARCAMEARNYADAERHINSALTAIHALGLTPLQAELLHTRATVRRCQGMEASAIADLEQAIELNERVRGSLPAERFRTAYMGTRSTTYEDMVGLLVRRGDSASMARAFEFVERGRSRSLLDLIHGNIEVIERLARRAADPAEAALLNSAASIRGELNALYGRLSELPAQQPRRAARELNEAVVTRERELQILESRLAAMQQGGGIFAQSASLADVQAALDGDAALIQYFAADGWLSAFVITPQQAQLINNLVDLRQLHEQLDRALFQIGRAVAWTAHRGAPGEQLGRDARHELAGLCAMILTPLNDAIAGAKRLYVVPHGRLHGVPFHALYDGHRFQLETRTIAVAPSASLLIQLRSSSSLMSDEGRPLIIEVPDEHAPAIKAEGELVSSMLPGSDRLIAEQATVEAVERQCPRASLIHLACHARFCPSAPLASGLKLANGWLTMREIYGLRLESPLVTLSGCDTARAVIAAGQEPIGLVRAFFAAGASALIMSQWTLHDESAAETIAKTYRLWHNGPDRSARAMAAALRTAQLEAACSERSHPALWAPFVFIGGI